MTAFLLVGVAAAAAYLVQVAATYGSSVADRNALVFAVKLFLVCGLSLHFVLVGRRSMRSRTARLVDFCERNTAGVLAGLIVATSAIAFLTTPQIGFGAGRLGLGYGHDGAIYGAMTEQFGAAHPIHGQFGYRFLPPLLVHYSGLDTFSGFHVLNLTSHALATVLLWRVACRAGLTRFAGLLAVAFFGTLKFGLKFLVYYPVIADGLGELLLLAIIWATLEKRHIVYALSMAAAVATRENLLVLMPFHALHMLRTARGWRRVIPALLDQVPAIAAYWLSRKYPVFPGATAFPAWFVIKAGALQFVLNPDAQQRLILAYINAVGVPLLVLGLSWRRVIARLSNCYEWAYYVTATVALSAVAGADRDRFATWLAPVAIIGFLRLKFPRQGSVPPIWLYWFLVHAAAMEFFLPWFPDESFYRARYAAHAHGMAIAQIAMFSWALIAVVVVLAWSAAGRQTGSSPAYSSTSR